MSKWRRVSCLLPGLLFVPALIAQNVVTGSYDNARTNADLNETILSPGTVKPSGFGKLFSIPVDGQIYAQPLYLSSVQISGSARNVLYVATLHNSVYALDANAPGPPLWTVNLGTPVPTSAYSSDTYTYADITPENGILGTPVIDASSGTLYVVAATFENGTFYYRLHALDVSTGAEKFGAPVVITAQVPGIGDSSINGTVAFVAGQHIQRPALLLLNGIVYVSFGAHGDQAPYHGWMMGYNAGNVQQQTAIANFTPNGSGGSVWQSGRGPTADDQGNIYVVTANGNSDETTSYSDNILRLTPGDLSISDWFAPFNVQTLNDTDDDLGSCGAVLIPGSNLLVTGGKQGIVYLLDKTSLGHMAAVNSQILESFDAGNLIFNLALWNRPDGPIVYLHAANAPFTAWQIAGNQISQAALSQTISAYAVPFQGMTLSANGGQPGSGILWATTADSYPLPSSGTLRAYNADDLSTELWDSSMNSADNLGMFAKFANPTVANGKVYVPTTSNQVVVYGLSGSGATNSNPVISAVVNAGSYATAPLAPGEIVAIFGANLGPKTLQTGVIDADGNLSNEIAGTVITFNEIPAPLLYVSSGVAAAIVPFEVSGAVQVAVQVNSNGRISASRTFSVASAAPGIFSLDATGSGPGAVLNQDYTVNSASNPAVAGSVVMLYATGGGRTDPASSTGSLARAVTPLSSHVSATIGGLPATVLYAGSAPAEVNGVLQVNVQLPNGVAGQGTVPILLTIGGKSSQTTVTIAVQ